MNIESADNVVGVCKCCSDEMKKAWQNKNKNIKINIGDHVKVAIKDKNGSEHLWFEIIQITGEKYLGRCDNEPVLVKSIKYGLLHEFKFKDIENHMPLGS